ncbi:glycosyltransferase [Geomonas sp. Red32]|uniref:glycosyltransferase n=1 Tax=Geomonas sp. Red32 TaxID=2912856 RepID=UPI00202CCD2A|nr:glycosyltransferase [Geomonas sp. Red32]MCM0083343.1 glycosyltransferase [Geomonas sp. Red32]
MDDTASGKRLKLCHVVATLETGGMENGVVNLCNRHDRTLFQPMVCCLKQPGAMVRRLAPDVKVFCLNIPEGKAPLAPLAVARLFRRERPDIAHTHGWGGGAWAGVVGARLAGCRLVINGEHGTLFTGWRQVLLQKVVALLCDRTFSVSQALTGKLASALTLNPHRVTVITNGVDLDRFHPRPRELEGGSDPLVLCSVGTLKEHKNQILTLKAVRELVRSVPGVEVQFLLVGDGPDREMLGDYVEREGLSSQVRFLGRREDIPEILGRCDVLVSSSRSEAFSNVVLEAMASGAAVVSTRSNGTEQIVEEGETGFVIEVDDLPALAARLRFLAGNREATRRLGENGRALVARKYSIERMVGDYEREYLRLYLGSTGTAAAAGTRGE